MKTVLIMAGGTGGHVFPGLAVANYLRDKQIDVHWLGTARGLEFKVVPEEQIPLHLVDIGGVRGKGIKTKLLAPFRIAKAVWQSIGILRKVKPDVVIGMGGFVSGPGGLAAWLLRIPLVIHEQNAKAGLTNKLLSLFARRVLQGFPGAFPDARKVQTVGNPVRHTIENLPGPKERIPEDRQPLRLLVLGGSLGAKALNETVPNSLAKLDASMRPEVCHQTGDKHLADTKNIYDSLGLRANLIPFVKDMAEVYSWADMVICRAGALTVSELCAAGLGAVFVPFPFAVDDHQTANAQFMVKNDAALCIQQRELSESQLADILQQFVSLPGKRLQMAEKAYQLRNINVAEKIYQICEEITH